MNLLHMKYALVVAEKHSINKAAQQLIVGAPALSRAVKELENSLGVILFERSVKGMTLTPDGELFVMYAKKALKQINDIENIFRNGPTGKQHFSISGSGGRSCGGGAAAARNENAGWREDLCAGC